MLYLLLLILKIPLHASAYGNGNNCIKKTRFNKVAISVEKLRAQSSEERRDSDSSNEK